MSTSRLEPMYVILKVLKLAPYSHAPLQPRLVVAAEQPKIFIHARNRVAIVRSNWQVQH